MSPSVDEVQLIDAELRALFRRALDGEFAQVSLTRRIAGATWTFAWLTLLMFNLIQLACEFLFSLLHQWGRTQRYNGLDVEALGRSEGQVFLIRESDEVVPVNRDRRHLQMVNIGDGRRLLVLIARPNGTWMRIDRIPLALFNEPPPRDDAVLHQWRSFTGHQTIAATIPIDSLSP